MGALFMELFLLFVYFVLTLIIGFVINSDLDEEIDFYEEQEQLIEN
jgi:hypothetical protein